MANDSTLETAASKLHLKPERHAAFARLALYHLRTTATIYSTQYGSPTYLDSATISFLKEYGPAVWPAYAPSRGHLTTDSTVSTGIRRGLLYAQSAQLVRANLKAWKAANDGREPTAGEQTLGSPLGKLVKAYLQALIHSDTIPAMQTEATGQELLRSVVCEKTGDQGNSSKTQWD